MKTFSVLVVGAAVLIAGMSMQAGRANAGDGKACTAKCFSSASMKLADARGDRCYATLNACRAKCPPQGNPRWEKCVTTCGEALEHCLGG